MKKIINVNVALILFILIVASSNIWAQTNECELLINLVKKDQLGKTIDLLNETNVNCEANGGGTPLINAARLGNLSMVGLLTVVNADVNKGLVGDANPLIQASRNGHLEIVAYLIQKGADVNAFIEEDETPLINATAKGHLEIVHFLIANGADVNKAVWTNQPEGRELRSPLLMAKRYKHKKVAELLIKRGASR